LEIETTFVVRDMMCLHKLWIDKTTASAHLLS